MRVEWPGLATLLDAVLGIRADVARLVEAGRPWAADDLLTAEEARRRLRAGKDNREARMLLDRTERRHAPGDARWRWGDLLEAMREATPDPGAAPSIAMVDLRVSARRPGARQDSARP